jgi:Uma2 family endonuclease
MSSASPSIEDLDRFDVQVDGRVRPALRMTEEEFEAWSDAQEARAEWVDGEVVLMSPSNLLHSRLQVWLLYVLRTFLDRRPLGEVLGPEFTVRLPRRRRVPDVLFLTRERASLLRPKYLDGAPDAAFEIVSPDSQSRDRREKYVEYERAGVREYWIIDPLSRVLEPYALGADGKYALIPQADGKVTSAVLAGFSLKADWLWSEPLPTADAVLREMGV